MSSAPALSQPIGAMRRRFLGVIGGQVRARVVVLLACFLALDNADLGMIGAIAGKLEKALSLSNTELGLLAAIPSLVAAAATVPLGVFTDRINRVRLIAASTALWSVAMVLSALAHSFLALLLTRMALGAAAAAAGPAVASLVGDFFAPRERARMYGMILSGELLGAGFGYVVSGEIASTLGWRAAFLVLAVPSLAIGVALWRLLPEPARGGRGVLRPGATTFVRGESASSPPAAEAGGDAPERSLVQRKVDESDIAPDEALMLRQDPAHMDLWSATKAVLRVRSNVILIISSALGYFYLTGVETFGLVFFQARYHLSQSVATLLLGLLGLGAIVGVVAGGRLADGLVAHGRITGRILVGAASSIAAAALFLPALLVRSLPFALPLYVIAATAFSAREPALDAARLDILHHRLWGRAEAVRTVLRRVMVATAPLVFGFVADELGSRRAASSSQHGFGAGASASGLHATFLILIVTLLAGGIITLRATATYPRDVASAVASEEAHVAC